MGLVRIGDWGLVMLKDCWNRGGLWDVEEVLKGIGGGWGIGSGLRFRWFGLEGWYCVGLFCCIWFWLGWCGCCFCVGLLVDVFVGESWLWDMVNSVCVLIWIDFCVIIEICVLVRDD